jgi:putative phosphoribosyl transferase
MRFRDRQHAGELLAEKLQRYAGRDNVLVLGLPRGGIPVALEVAQALGAPMDVFVVRKLGVPGHEELAMGALASGGVCVINESVVAELGIEEATIARVAAAENPELRRREHVCRGDEGPIEMGGRTVILVDDGIATGSTMRAAVLAVRAQDPERLVVAVPAADKQAYATFHAEVDEIVCLLTPEPFHAVGSWYEDFAPLSDEVVRELRERRTRAPSGAIRR